MNNAKRTLSIVLTVLMIITSVPLTALTSSAANSRHDFTVDFDYEYDTPEQALEAAREYQNRITATKNSGEIKWNHVTKLTNYNDGDVKKKLMSENPADKYIVLDNDVGTTSAHTDWQEIVIRADKVLDLNGYEFTLHDKRNKVDTHDDATDKYYQSSDSKDFQTVMFRIENGATLTIIDSSEKGTGKIYIDAYMVNPYQHAIRRYTT